MYIEKGRFSLQSVAPYMCIQAYFLQTWLIFIMASLTSADACIADSCGAVYMISKTCIRQAVSLVESGRERSLRGSRAPCEESHVKGGLLRCNI